MTDANKINTTYKIYKMFQHFDKALTFDDVKLWVDYYVMIGDKNPFCRTIDRLRSHDEYQLRNNGKGKLHYSVEKINDWELLKHYFLLTIDGVDEQVINKIWFEELGLTYQHNYDVNLVDLLLQGYRQREIADKLGVSESRIAQMFKEGRELFVPAKITYRGKLCKHKHDDGTGHSIRYKTSYNCVVCVKKWGSDERKRNQQ